jgi:hypothetical protein
MWNPDLHAAGLASPCITKSSGDQHAVLGAVAGMAPHGELKARSALTRSPDVNSLEQCLGGPPLMSNQSSQSVS